MIIKLYYEDLVVTEISTSRSMSVDEALTLIDFNEDQFLKEHGFDCIDYNDFSIKY